MGIKNNFDIKTINYFHNKIRKKLQNHTILFYLYITSVYSNTVHEEIYNGT